MDSYNKKIIRLFVFLILFSCENKKSKSFYEFSMKENDVWRLPIVEPYEMYSAYCCSEWFIEGNSPLGKRFGIKQRVDSVNYFNHKLIIYDGTEYKEKWILLNFENDNTIKFNERLDLKEYLMRDTLEFMFFGTENVFNSWEKTDSLPWKQSLPLTPYK